MKLKKEITLPYFEYSSMYDIRDFIVNFETLGTNMTFYQTIDFFKEANILPMDNYIKTSAKRIAEMCLKLYFDSIQKGEEAKELELYIKRCKDLYPIEYQNMVEYISKERIIEYNYLTKSISILKTKGLIYLSMLQYIANNSKPHTDDIYWDSLFSELDITYNNTLILGADIKRILTVLFNTQLDLKFKLMISNDLLTYDNKQIGVDLKEAFKNDEFYPSENILSSIIFADGDDTSISMSKRQKKISLNENLKRL